MSLPVSATLREYHRSVSACEKGTIHRTQLLAPLPPGQVVTTLLVWEDSGLASPNFNCGRTTIRFREMPTV